MPLVELKQSDGSWDRLKAGWAAQCEAAGEDFSQYARGAFIVLDELAAAPERRAGVFGIQRGDELPDVVCQVNTTPLPGHPEPVLRVRMVTVCPDMDFGNRQEDAYIDALVNLFFGVVELQERDLGAKEVKFHLRSPSDYAFFRALRVPLGKIADFESVAMHGAWLYVTKRA